MTTSPLQVTQAPVDISQNILIVIGFILFILVAAVLYTRYSYVTGGHRLGKYYFIIEEQGKSAVMFGGKLSTAEEFSNPRKLEVLKEHSIPENFRDIVQNFSWYGLRDERINTALAHHRGRTLIGSELELDDSRVYYKMKTNTGLFGGLFGDVRYVPCHWGSEDCGIYNGWRVVILLPYRADERSLKPEIEEALKKADWNALAEVVTKVPKLAEVRNIQRRAKAQVEQALPEPCIAGRCS